MNAESEIEWRWRPGLVSFLIAFSFSILLLALLRLLNSRPGPLGWYTSALWTLPIVLTVQGVAGALYTRHLMTQRMQTREPAHVPCPESLVVVLPTVGRKDMSTALIRVLTSFCTDLPGYFRHLRVDVVVEEGCDLEAELLRFQAANPLVRIVTVPRDFRPTRGTKFKARAIHYAHLLRQQEGEARSDVWVLHMDDDTSVSPYTAAEIACFINAQRVAVDGGKHLAQGILTYPRELSRNRLSWYADAVRPGCDISFFPITTGRGVPRIGLHGELLLVRASVEAQIGWDFGPRTIVEDAEFALRFCEAHPGRSAWIPACSYGSSPATVRDFVKQRERWVWGLLTLLTQRSICLRRRLLLLPTIVLWACAPLGNPVALVVVGLLIGNADTAPLNILIGSVWATNFGFCVWLYWEGFAINRHWSAERRGRYREGIVVVAGTPLFAVMECIGIASGVARFVRRVETEFVVIEKPV